MNHRRRVLAGLLLLPATALLPGWAQAGSQPLRIVVPYPAGGTMDAMMRIIQEPLGKALGQTIIVDNRAGAAGMIGTLEVKKAPLDGNTLLLFNNGMSITPLIQHGTKIDFANDFSPVSIIAEGPMVIFANAATPVNDIKGLVAAAKANPGGLNYASTGTGGTGHLTMEIFARQAGIKMTHVPYKGQAPAMMAVMAGEVPLAIATMSDAALQSMQTGKIKALAVTSRQASPTVPGVPAISDTVKGFGISATYAFLAPQGTPAQMVQKLNAAIVKVMAQPDIRARYVILGNVARSSTPKEVASMIEKEAAQWKEAVDAGNIHIE
jgi:tripartite-type tricarboxylate transporter receptor subunit TctC